MDRRAALFAIGALCTGRHALAQPADIPRVVVINNTTSEMGGPFVERFVAGMRQQGYVDRRNYVLEVHYAMNEQSRIAPLINEAIATRPKILVVSGLFAAREARRATSTLPIVVTTGSDLVDSGLVQSYAHPGGNLTGVADLTDDAAVKRLELLKAALPKASRVALLTNPDFPATPKITRMVGAAATSLGITLVPISANDLASLVTAIDSLARSRPDALLLGGDNNAVSHAGEIIRRSNEARIPVVYFWPNSAERGALFSYQADIMANFERAASYAARILKGAKPGDLPIELPNRYELVVNRKAASDLGIVLPSTFLQRADRVVDTIERPAR